MRRGARDARYARGVTPPIRIALDAMGSDHGPEVVALGAAQASLAREAPEIVIVGDHEVLSRALAAIEHAKDKIRLVHADDVIAQTDDPRKAVTERRGSSIAVAAGLLVAGEADALVSAGNTGAVTMECARTFERLPGVSRCALGAVYPTERRRGEKDDPFSLILDAGLTLDVNADDLVCFAVMGSAYARCISQNPKPRVALLSVGSEASKGTAAVVEAHLRLRRAGDLEFIGNIEGMDIPRGTADVVVTGGFTGNIVLKMLEGVSDTVLRLARYAGESSLQYKAGLALLSPAIRKLRKATDWQQYGGAPVLGFSHLCIKAHGRSTERAIRNAIRVAQRSVATDTVRTIRDGLARVGG